ncbi:S8 family peptidase [Effusibacillus consociatus]|uniref:S8 family peptidase n=1 Tax=Effusibacillus consociatus TaxID=1117041 RepID=A0ABV9PYA1_9BACL
MGRFAKILYGVTKPNGGGKSERLLIVLKNKHCYHKCLWEMKSVGLQPVKKLFGIHAVCCHVPEGADLFELQRHGMVKRIERDVKVKLHQESQPVISSQTTPWGIRRIRANEVWNDTTGRRVKVAVLDTGISDHTDLKVAGRHSTINQKQALDPNGHGTHVAGTIAALNNTFGVVGVAPNVSLYAVKAFQKNGSAFLSDIIEGITWCIRNGMQVINMSFGMSQRSESLHEVIQRAFRNGIVMVASAGNDGPNNQRLDYPALFSETIAVAAAAKGEGIANFSSRGEGIDVSAPGVGILSTVGTNRYQEKSGTSMAAPHVTGTAALLLSLRPSLTTDEIKSILRSTATPISGYSQREQGSGIINAERAVNSLR